MKYKQGETRRQISVIYGAGNSQRDAELWSLMKGFASSVVELRATRTPEKLRLERNSIEPCQIMVITKGKQLDTVRAVLTQNPGRCVCPSPVDGGGAFASDAVVLCPRQGLNKISFSTAIETEFILVLIFRQNICKQVTMHKQKFLKSANRLRVHLWVKCDLCK